MFKVNSSILSQNSIGTFLTKMNVHDHITRNKLDFHVIPHSLIVREFSKKNYGVKLWNNLPAFLKDINNFILFRYKFKVYFLLQ